MRLGTTLLASLLVAAACARPARDPWLTYFNADFGFSVRYPASWKTEQAEQDGTWYRYFLAPPAGEQSKPAVSVTLHVAPQRESPLEAHARPYLEGMKVLSEREEARGAGALGRRWELASPDGKRYALLLLAADARVYGLYAQGEAEGFTRNARAVQEMGDSLALERAALYPERRDPAFRLSLRLPSSWRESRHLSSKSTLLLQFVSPALAADPDGNTVHSSLTVTVEPAEGDLEEVYQAARRKLGEAFGLISHNRWGDGVVDVMRAETPLSVSRVKRFYRVSGGRAYTLAFEAREDVYHRVARWCDAIAGTLKAGLEMTAP